ncbi:hypothetical protein ACVWY2_009068 [Bradyrhizobium sp. JR6.1]
MKATLSNAGSKVAARLTNTVHTMASWPSPMTGRAAMYTRIVPNSASAMPTLPRMKYFQAASSAAWVR